MSSPDSEYNSPTGINASPDQVEANVLNGLVRVGSLINAELEFANRRVTRSVYRENSQVRQHVLFYERKSLSNLTTGSADCIHELPLYQAAAEGRNSVSAPVTPALSVSSESLVSTHSLPDANMSQNEDQQALRRVSTEETPEGFPGFPSTTTQWDLCHQSSSKYRVHGKTDSRNNKGFRKRRLTTNTTRQENHGA